MPETGCVVLPTYDFAEQFSEFSFHSLLTKPEVILTSIKVKAECVKVLKMNMFNIHISKSSRLEEFEQAQMQASDQVANYLRETWLITLKNSIKNSFKDVGKGWYNIHETNRETYEFSKLKKFLNMIRYLMEDTLRFLVEDSLQRFTSFIQGACRIAVSVRGTNSVENEPAPAGTKRVPLLSIELVIKEDGLGFDYSTPLSLIPAKVVAVFNHAIQRVTGISQLEPSIMENLFWAYHPQLTAVHPMEPEVVALREAVEGTVQTSLVALREYLDCFKVHEEFLALDVDAYVEVLKAKGEDLALAELKTEEAKAKRELAELRENIPLNKVVCMSLVNCSKVREKLLLKKERQVRLLQELIAYVPRTAMQTISKKFNDINLELKKQCTTIEEVDAMRKYIEDLPRTLLDLRQEVTSTKDWYKALGDLRYALPEEDFRDKEKGEGWHMKLQRTVANTLKVCSNGPMPAVLGSHAECALPLVWHQPCHRTLTCEECVGEILLQQHPPHPS